MNTTTGAQVGPSTYVPPQALATDMFPCRLVVNINYMDDIRFRSCPSFSKLTHPADPLTCDRCRLCCIPIGPCPRVFCFLGQRHHLPPPDAVFPAFEPVRQLSGCSPSGCAGPNLFFFSVRMKGWGDHHLRTSSLINKPGRIHTRVKYK